MTDQWYYAVGKDKIGPLPESKIKELILNGQITLKDLLWKKGMTTWLRLEKVDEFAEFLNLKKDENTPPPLVEEPISGSSESSKKSLSMLDTKSLLEKLKNPKLRLPGGILFFFFIMSIVMSETDKIVFLMPVALVFAWFLFVFNKGVSPSEVQKEGDVVSKQSTGKKLSKDPIYNFLKKTFQTPEEEYPTFVLNSDFLISPLEILDTNKVTVEVYFAGVKSNSGNELCIFIDEMFVGGGRMDLGIAGEEFETTVDRHVFKIQLMGDRVKTKVSDEASFNIHFDKPGHYKIELLYRPSDGIFTTLPTRLLATLTKNYIEKLRPSVLLKNRLVGLWSDVNQKGLSLMFTSDGVMVREDGLMAKYKWSEKYILDIFEISSSSKVSFHVFSLGLHELILTLGGETAHYTKTKTLTEIEMEKQKAIYLKESQVKSEIYKNKALGTSALIASGGFAILSAGVGIGAAAAGAGIGMAGAASSSSSNDPNNGMKRCKACGGQGSRLIGSSSTSCGSCFGKGWS